MKTIHYLGPGEGTNPLILAADIRPGDHFEVDADVAKRLAREEQWEICEGHDKPKAKADK
jgi:hypothetical protein